MFQCFICHTNYDSIQFSKDEHHFCSKKCLEVYWKQMLCEIQKKELELAKDKLLNPQKYRQVPVFRGGGGVR